MSEDFEYEAVPGLPEELPKGEVLLWQGHPDFMSMARHSFHAGKVAFYFAIVVCARIVWQAASGLDITSALANALPVAAFGLCGVALLMLLAWLTSKTTIYSLTSRRIVMRYGIALPMTVNIPFCEISAADFKPYADGSGDIALKTDGPLKLAYFNLWPNVRPWHVKESQPALRSVPSAQATAALFAEHWQALRGRSAVTAFNAGIAASVPTNAAPDYANGLGDQSIAAA